MEMDNLMSTEAEEISEVEESISLGEEGDASSEDIRNRDLSSSIGDQEVLPNTK